MIQVSLKKVPKEALEVLQDEVLNYAQGFTEHLRNPDDTTVFYYSIAQVDLANRLWYFLRPKVERGKECSFTLKAAEGTVLFNACSNASITTDNDYTRHVTSTYRDIIDEQFKKLVVAGTASNTIKLLSI